RDRSQDRARVELPRADVQFLHDRLDDATLVGRVIDHEVRVDADLAAVLAQDARRERVEGAHHHPAGAFAHKALDAVLHFAGGLVCEGKRQDIPGRDVVLLDEVGDADGEYARLAAPRTGDDQQRAVDGSHGQALFRVEWREEIDLAYRGIGHRRQSLF